VTIGVLASDRFQDSEYFLPTFELEKMGVQTEIISLTREMIEIDSFFSRIGQLDVNKSIPRLVSRARRSTDRRTIRWHLERRLAGRGRRQSDLVEKPG
jgi:putative intracellular protease/amidase